MTVTRSDNPTPTEIHTWYWWRPERSAEKEPGIRIARGGSFIWIPYSDALTVATAIADAIEERQRRANERRTNRKDTHA